MLAHQQPPGSGGFVHWWFNGGNSSSAASTGIAGVVEYVEAAAEEASGSLTSA